MKVDYLNKALKGQKQYEYGVEWGLAHPHYFTHKVCSHLGLLLFNVCEGNKLRLFNKYRMILYFYRNPPKTLDYTVLTEML
jgi:hypothetical protein